MGGRVEESGSQNAALTPWGIQLAFQAPPIPKQMATSGCLSLKTSTPVMISEWSLTATFNIVLSLGHSRCESVIVIL